MDFCPSLCVRGAEAIQELWNKGKPGQEAAVLSPQEETKLWSRTWFPHSPTRLHEKASPAPLGRFPTPVISGIPAPGASSCFFHQPWKPKKTPNTSSELRKSWILLDELFGRILWKNPKDLAITSQSDTTAQEWKEENICGQTINSYNHEHLRNIYSSLKIGKDLHCID